MQDRTSARSTKPSCNARPDHTFGSFTSFSRCPRYVRSSPNSGGKADVAALLIRATSRHMRCRKKQLFDHLIGSGKQRRRDVEPERLGRNQVDDEIEFGRLFDRDVAWLRPTQNLVDIAGGTTE